jgi:hypothetical protein
MKDDSPVSWIGFAVITGVRFLPVVIRSVGRQEPITPRRTIALALLTLGAAVTAPFASNLAALSLPWFGQARHSLWHLLWALLMLTVAFGLHRFRSAWSATGWTERCLAVADLLVRGIVAGNLLALAGALVIDRILNFEWSLAYTSGLVVHNAGDFLALVSLWILLLNCLVMLGVGVRAALRPTPQGQITPAP